MEKVQWKVEGMTCSNCALTIHKFLEKQGMKDVKVNAIGGDVSFEMNDVHTKVELAKGIKDPGYKVAGDKELTHDKKSYPIFADPKILVLFSIHRSFNAAHDTRCAYPLANESLDTTCSFIACVHSGDEFFWKECCKKFAKRNAEYGCAYCIGSYRSICL